MLISTGLRNFLLTSGSFKDAMDGSIINIYAGDVPPSADASIGAATLLVTISLSDTGSGVSFNDVATNGVLSKNPAEVWSGQVIANGTASFFRMTDPADPGDSSTTVKRIQGTVGVLNADYLVSNTSFVNGEYRQIDSFNVAIPA